MFVGYNNRKGSDEMTFTKKQLEECLSDAGCSEEEKAEILQYYADENMQEMIHLLRIHRKAALDTIHTGEKQISCLDYLVYQLEKEIRTKN